MKHITYFIFVLLVIVSSFSCQKKSTEEIIIDEKVIINNLSENDFYKQFFKYNIWRNPREERFGYIIETDSIKEFWVHFNESDGVYFSKKNEIYLENKLMATYSKKYIELKKTIVSDLNKLISFMVKIGIKSSEHVEGKRIFWSLKNECLVGRYYTKLKNEEVESLKKYYNEVTVVDSNWVILKKPKM